uniref:Uncharacterized protein n=1 Tax=Siphoviridae sp. ctZHD14 TaxID=2827891 RepID=A0A8S5SWC5_9CAUD|nr:MAG TPA: hypothetical protein [Siphoviridae sp. ctZHD14]
MAEPHLKNLAKIPGLCGAIFFLYNLLKLCYNIIVNKFELFKTLI